MLVIRVHWILNKSDSVTSKASPHHHTSSMLQGGNHTFRRPSVHLLCISQRHSGWNQKSQILTHQTKGHISTGLNVHCSCFLAQVSLFLLLVSFSSGFFAAIRPSALNSWCWDVYITWALKHLFGLHFLRLVTWWFLRLTFMSYCNDELSLLFAYLSCPCHNMDVVFLPDRAIFCLLLPLPCHNTIVWFKCIKKERHSTNELLTRHSLHSRWLPHEAVMKAKGGYFEESQMLNIFWFV
jgi:hypothetical protein